MLTQYKVGLILRRLVSLNEKPTQHKHIFTAYNESWLYIIVCWLHVNLNSHIRQLWLSVGMYSVNV